MDIKYDNPVDEKQGIMFEVEKKRKNKIASSGIGISQERLREAVIWSEILGKPICKRRKRREG